MTNSPPRHPTVGAVNMHGRASSGNMNRPRGPPKAPPGADRAQLELWRRILSQRSEQLETLPPAVFRSYVDGIALHLKTSRFKRVAGGRREIDLAGYHSSHLISQHPPPDSIAVEDVVRHIMALFYRSVDEQLSPNERKYGLDAVKNAFASLDDALAKQYVQIDASDVEKKGGNASHVQNNSGNVHEQQKKKRSRDELPASTDTTTQAESGRPTQAENSSNDQVEPSTSHDDSGHTPMPNAVVVNGFTGNNKDGHAEDLGPIAARNGATYGMNKQSQPSGGTDEKRKGNNDTDERKGTDSASKRQRIEQSDATANGQKDSNQGNCADDFVILDSSSDDDPASDKGTGPTGRPNQSVSKARDAPGRSPGSAKKKDQPGKSPSQLPSTQKNDRPFNGSKATRGEVAPPKGAIVQALPSPLPYSCMRRVTFVADNHTPYLASASLHPRNPCTLSYDAGFHSDGSGATLDHKASLDVRERLERFDPYWKIVRELGQQEVRAVGGKKTKASTRTAPCVSSVSLGNHPTSCAQVSVDLLSECNKTELSHLKWGVRTTAYKTGDKRIILRMLPLKRTDKDKKKADTHMWPIGSFVQLSQGTKHQVMLIAQRRQQSHDPTLWKGLCHPLDLTAILPNARSPFSVEICTREAIEKVLSPKYKIGSPVSKDFEGDDGEMRPFAGTIKRFDEEYKLYQIVYEDGDEEELTESEVASIVVSKNNTGRVEEPKILHGSYGIHLAVCEYIGPDELYDQLLESMQTIPLEASQRMARQYLVRQTVSIDDDDEDDDFSKSSLSFSLLCPMSRMAICTPVRGKSCKHMQCFDLKSFLHSNTHVSGGRWRCGVCEDFLSVDDLVRCGLFEAMLREHKEKVSGTCHEVSFKADGTWSLKEEETRRSAKEEAENGGKESSEKRTASQPEVIDLL